MYGKRITKCTVIRRPRRARMGGEPHSDRERKEPMTTFPVPSWLQRLFAPWLAARQRRRSGQRPPLSTLVQLDPTCLPRFVQESAVALQYLHLLGLLDWSRFPNGVGHCFAPGRPPLPHAALAATYLVKLDQHLPSVSELRQYLMQHPALVWVLGFPVSPSPTSPWGFDVEASQCQLPDPPR